MGFASDGRDRARSLWRALCLSGGTQVATAARRKLRRRPAGVVRGLERTAPQPFRFVSVQRAHGAALAADAGVSAAPALRHAGACHPAVAAAPLGDGGCPGRHAPADGSALVHRTDRDLARARPLRSGAAPSQPSHPAARRLSWHGGDHVVAGAVAGAGAAANPAPASTALPVSAGNPDVGDRGADYAVRLGPLSLLRDSTEGWRVIAARRSTDRWPADVGTGRIDAMDRDDRDLVPLLSLGSTGRRRNESP